MQQVLLLREKNDSLEKQVSSLFLYTICIFYLNLILVWICPKAITTRCIFFSQSLCILYVPMQQAKLLEEIKEHKVLAQISYLFSLNKLTFLRKKHGYPYWCIL
jgi:hypothetical protein